MTYFVMALALVLGLAQCKKDNTTEQPINEGGKVSITLDVDNGGNNGTRANVTPPNVSFVEGDRILVAYDGKYVGHIDHNGTCFTGTIDATGDNTKPLYFYFLGNKADVSGLTEGSSTTCTVNISDQSDYPHLPVISMAPSDQFFPSEGNHYSAHLLNKCSLMKFDVNSNSTAAICITGMNNKVTVNFGKVNELGDGLGATSDEGFSYSQDTDGGFMKLSGKDAQGKAYAIVLPQAELTTTGEAYTIDGYEGTRPALPALVTDEFYTSYTIDVSTQSAWDGDLAKLNYSSTEAFATAKNGMTIYGTYSAYVKVSIADGATVTLRNANIQMESWVSFAGLSCLGDATIILEDGTENTVKGGLGRPGIHVVEGKNLTIQGNTGKLFANGRNNGAGIGGGNGLSSGNIIINGGDITATGDATGAGIGSGSVSGGTITINDGIVRATGGMFSAGIGSGNNGSNCGTITISGGTVTATGTYGAGIGSGQQGNCSGGIIISGGTVTATGTYHSAGIGSGDMGSCGNIDIANTVDKVTATRYDDYSVVIHTIGPGSEGSCGTVTMGGTVLWDGTNYQNNGASILMINPLEFPFLASATGHSLAESIVGDIVGSDGLAYNVSDKDNLPVGVSARAMVAYKNGSNGLAIALVNTPYELLVCKWNEISGMITYWANEHPVTGKTWYLPSAYDWQHMFIGCGSTSTFDGSLTYDDFPTMPFDCEGFKSKLSDAGDTALNTNSNYWTSTELDSDYAWMYDFFQSQFSYYEKDDTCYVRACFAF